MSTTKFYSFHEGRGNLVLNPCCYSQKEWDSWDDLKIRKDEDIPKGELHFMVNPNFGKKFWDVVTAGKGLLYAVSEKVVKLLQDNNITGCKFYPITINDHEDLKYFLLTITGKCGPLDDSKAVFIETLSGPETKIQNSNITIPKQHFSVMKGKSVRLETWDGCDFFLVENTLESLVTERVKDLFKKHRINNVYLEDLKDYTWFLE